MRRALSFEAETHFTYPWIFFFRHIDDIDFWNQVGCVLGFTKGLRLAWKLSLVSIGLLLWVIMGWRYGSFSLLGRVCDLVRYGMAAKNVYLISTGCLL